MCNRCGNAFLAAIIVLFSFWELAFSKWIIVVAAGVILIKEGIILASKGCSACATCGTGSKLFMEKTDSELHEGPSKKELKEVLKGKKKEN